MRVRLGENLEKQPLDSRMGNLYQQNQFDISTGLDEIRNSWEKKNTLHFLRGVIFLIKPYKLLQHGSNVRTKFQASRTRSLAAR